MSKDKAFFPNNDAIVNITQVMKLAVTSATEAELGGIYVNVREAVYIKKTSTPWATRNHEHHCKQTTPPQRG